MIRILNAEAHGYSDQARAILQRLGQLTEGDLSRAELLARLPGYDVLIVRLAHKIDREVIDEGKNLKAIVTATTGLDHIDVEYARQKGITLLSLRGETAFLQTVSATAEHTWALLLALLRRIPAAYASVRAGQWDRDSFRGSELDGKRLGLVGLGRLGRKVARYGRAFGMGVAAYDPYVANWAADVTRVSSLPELLCRSDVLSLHIPLSAETESLLDLKALSLLPTGAVLVNTSRGEIIDEAALVQVLEHGHLAGAALDVIAHEREPERRQDSPLLIYARNHRNLLITPHIGGATHESMAKTEVFMADKLASFLRNSPVDGASIATLPDRVLL
jgi:D-3-phosphoglycerate dehydrogenase